MLYPVELRDQNGRFRGAKFGRESGPAKWPVFPHGQWLRDNRGSCLDLKVSVPWIRLE